MATTPHVPPPKPQSQQTSQPKAPFERPDPRAHEKAAEHHEKAAEHKAKAAPKHALLPEGQAWSLFYNGHRIAKDGDPPSKWASMSRLSDSTAVFQTPMTPELEEAIKGGSYYLAEGLTDEGESTAPVGPPTNVDIPMVSATGQTANCTMGNWNGEPTSYAYAWQRDGTPISGATSADYTMVSGDSGKPIGCIVTATNAAGSTAAPMSNTVIAP